MPDNTPAVKTRSTPPYSDPSIRGGNRPIYKPMAAPATRHTGALPDTRSWYRYWIIFGVLAALSVVFTVLTLVWGNPMPFGSEGFWIISKMRVTNLVVIAVVAFTQAIATVSFQTITSNRIITPSIMGFESLYVLVQTGSVFFFGAAGIMLLKGTSQFLFQILLMVVFSALLYGWLLSGRYGNLHVMLLVGIILGSGLGAISTFMQRLLTPSDFDILTARLIGSIANADATYLWTAIPIAALAGGALWVWSRRLNVLALGRETAINLGVNHRRQTIVILLLVSVLMAVSTSLVGPLTFFGFIVAMLAYQLADTHDHRYVFPIAWLTGFLALTSAHFILKNIFYAQGSVGIIIEIVGGTFFLVHILRKGRL